MTIRRRAIHFLAAVLLTPVALPGQIVTASNVDGITPPAVEGGAPDGSYSLSNLERLNYYNGNVNILIPLYHVGGRGTAGYAIFSAIERRWTVHHSVNRQTQDESFLPNTPLVPTPFGIGYVTATPYTPGKVVVRRAAAASLAAPIVCTFQGYTTSFATGPFLSRVVWIGADGSETVLRDLNYGGQPKAPLAYDCNTLQTFSVDRGKVFTSSDDSAMTFIADQSVHDAIGSGGAGDYPISGTLLFRDGTKYVIDLNGEVTTIEDRNGNYVTIAGQTTSTMTITDSLNRIITISRGATQDTINYPGYQGTVRSIIINKAPMDQVLATGQSLQTPKCLFPELGGSSSTQFDPTVVSSIVLPDLSSYSFRYNSYGEIAKFTLPTGGAYQYTYPQVVGCAGTGSGVLSVITPADYTIYRRLQRRDELSDGTVISAQTSVVLHTE